VERRQTAAEPAKRTRRAAPRRKTAARRPRPLPEVTVRETPPEDASSQSETFEMSEADLR
jgi:hypothetical protein